MPDDAQPMDDSYRAMRERYGVSEIPGRRMGKFSALSEKGRPEFFSLKSQLVKDGRSVNPLVETENLWAWIKVYASGGENTLHAHRNEDHLFVVLSGEATFYGPNEEEKTVSRNEGLMLPAGTFYRFCCTSEDPLVLMRVGARAHEGDLRERIGGDGSPLPGGSKKNKFKPPVYSEEYFE